MDPQREVVSIIVPTRNSSIALERCLISIRSQTYPHIELIVVDNYSRDRTAAIAVAYSHQLLVRGPERSAQRNAGARAAHGAWLLFVDSDMELDPHLVETCVAAIAGAPSYRALILPERSQGDGFWARCKALERSCYSGDDTVEAARFYDREVFEQVGGFDRDLSAFEDWDLHRRVEQLAPYGVGRAGSWITHHEGHLTLRAAIAKKYAYGRHFARYVAMHGILSATLQVQPLRPAYLRHWRILLADPLHLAGMLLLRTAEVSAGAVGALTGLLVR